MNTRGKRILQLLNKEECASVNVKTKDDTNTFKKCKLGIETLHGDKVYEFERDEDPWIEFKKWNKTRNPQKTEIQIEQDGKSNHTEDQSKSVTDFVDSSVSWRPFETRSDTISSDNQSNVSKEIPFVEPLKYEEPLDNISNSFGNPEITEICETKITPSISNEIRTDSCTDNKKIKILQNIILDPMNKDEHENKKTTADTKKAIANIQRVGIIGNSKKIVDVSHRKSRIWDKKDRCVYCDRDFTNFSRHLFRKHAKEVSVIQIMELPKGDQQRKKMINLLRKEGNLTLLDDNKIRPVQRPTQKYDKKENSENTQEFIPCPYCKGIYRMRSLRRHSKICSYNQHNGEKCNIASLGQNLLVFQSSRKTFLNTLRVKDEVFPTMHADRASFNGKNDPIICQYAEDYLRKHKRPHIRSAVSNKIRELGRLLIPLKDIYGFNGMLEVMNTKNYDKVVHAAQIISGYDATTKQFKSPSLAMHMKTILLSACLAAKTLLLKEDPVLAVTDYSEKLKAVKHFRLLVDERWKFDMSSLALKDLNEKHGIKAQTLPITSDVIKFRQYAVNIAEECIDVLRENDNDLVSFKKLTEAVLVLTILLNRKRVGDVQYIKLDSYTQDMTSTNQEECLNVLSDSEKLLSAHFKRIITIGKGSKSIPILFPKNVQTYVDILLSAREKNELIPKENPFLFALIGSKEKWVDGSSVLRKYAVSCGAENPKTLTSSRLRKQIATVLQVINLNETEKEQVASFMGHTKKTHDEFYRLPQDIYQTAKIAKLLLMMDKGEGAEYQGKTLEEIDVQLEVFNEEVPEASENDIDSNEEEEEEDTETADCGIDFGEGTSKVRQKVNKKERKERQRGSWNEKQKSVMKKFFKKHISSKTSPKKHECLELQNKHKTLFKDKTWVQIKVFVYNIFKKQ